ncbi:hypothetical protein ACKKBG_A00915 [Auxenochlorella protothecoides x Auxenochlorella symbiontica]
MEPSGGSAGQLLVSSALPVVEMCLIGGIGALMVHKKLFDASSCTALARACLFIFIPCLTFGKLAQSVTLDSVLYLWPLVANIVVSLPVGLALGWAAARLTGMPRAYTPHAMCCVAFGNVGNLPLVFVAALCHDPHTIFFRRLGAPCEVLGMSYTAFAILGATVLQFTVAIQLLKPEPELAVEVVGGRAGDFRLGPGSDAAAGAGAPARGAAAADPAPRQCQQAPGKRGAGSEEEGHMLAVEHPQPIWELARREDSDATLDLRSGSLLSVELPLMSSPRMDSAAGLAAGREGAGEGARLLPGAAAPVPERHEPGAGQRAANSFRGGLRHCARRLAAVPWASFFPLPTQAALAGVVVGCIAPARNALYGHDAPLTFLGDTIETLGNGLIPCTIVLLGAVLYRSSRSASNTLSTASVAATIASRLVFCPAIMTGLIMLALKLKLIQPVDPLFVLCLLLPNCSPTAINIQTMTVLYKHGEAEVSKLLFWCYIAAVLTLPAWTWVFLQIIQRIDFPPRPGT